MRVYISQRVSKGEGFEILGVFRSKPEAEKACRQSKISRRPLRYETFEISQYELGKIVEAYAVE